MDLTIERVMTLHDSGKSLSSTTSGLASASQVVSGTVLPTAPRGEDLTAPTPQRPRVAVRLVSRLPFTVKGPPRVVAEAQWKRLLAKERKKAKRRGLRPSDVDRAIEAFRYPK